MIQQGYKPFEIKKKMYETEYASWLLTIGISFFCIENDIIYCNAMV